jgi:hypothetical protein
MTNRYAVEPQNIAPALFDFCHCVLGGRIGFVQQPECFAMQERIGGFAPRVFQNPPKRSAGDAHAFGGIGMVEAVKIGQAQRFQLIGLEALLFHVMQGHASGLENIARGVAGSEAFATRTGHKNGAPYALFL